MSHLRWQDQSAPDPSRRPARPRCSCGQLRNCPFAPQEAQHPAHGLSASHLGSLPLGGQSSGCLPALGRWQSCPRVGPSHRGCIEPRVLVLAFASSCLVAFSSSPHLGTKPVGSDQMRPVGLLDKQDSKNKTEIIFFSKISPPEARDARNARRKRSSDARRRVAFKVGDRDHQPESLRRDRVVRRA